MAAHNAALRGEMPIGGSLEGRKGNWNSRAKTLLPGEAFEEARAEIRCVTYRVPSSPCSTCLPSLPPFQVLYAVSGESSG
jgi:hypothetical protein